MAAGLSRGHADEFHKCLLSGGNAGDLSAANSACGDSGCLAAQTGVAGSLLYRWGLARERLRRRLHLGSSAALACEHREHQVLADSGGVERAIRYFPEKDRVPFYFAATGIPEDCKCRLDDADSYVVVERGSRSDLQRISTGHRTEIFQDRGCYSSSGGCSEMATRRCGIRRDIICAG